MRLTLVLLAAGRASRFGRLKQLEPVGPQGASLMAYGMHDALRAGVDRIVLVVPPGEESRFEDHVRRQLGPAFELASVPQHLEPLPPGYAVPSGRTKPWGTAHAVLAAEPAVDGPFLVANADDHYGRAAYDLLARWLAAVPSRGTRFALAGYRLGDTLSPFGGVSRAVCRSDADGTLRTIEEVLQVVAGATGLAGVSVSGAPVALAEADRVSMNLWAFTPAVFPLLREQLAAFLETHAADPGAEFLIPTAATAQIAQGLAGYQLLPTAAPWFGLTFPEDTDAVRTRIAEMHARGDYPFRLEEGIA